MKIKPVLCILFALLTACGSNATEPALPSQGNSATPTTLSVTEVPPTVADPASGGEANAAPSAIPPADTDPGHPDEQPILTVFSQPVTAQGELLILYGHVLDRNGQPQSGYAVEIWQVDTNGSYDHPNDPSTQNRDRDFQFYGTSLTDENGLFAFRTIVPARYEPRPRHIHFKVKKDGAGVLTSQFYFSDDVDASQLGAAGEMLLLDLREAQDKNGNPVKLAYKDLVVNAGSGGDMTLTPSQTEGPYYPVVDVSAFDNDLANGP